MWRLTKGKARLELEAEKKRKADNVKAKSNTSIGGLAGYGDSDEESDDGEGNQDAAPEEQREEDGGPPAAGVSSVAELAPEPDEEVKAARRARAREWAEKRRAAKEATDARTDNS